MRAYLTRLTELVAVGFLTGATSYIAQNGLDYSAAGVRGLLVAGATAVYGLLVKQAGADKERPTLGK